MVLAKFKFGDLNEMVLAKFFGELNAVPHMHACVTLADFKFGKKIAELKPSPKFPAIL